MNGHERLSQSIARLQCTRWDGRSDPSFYTKRATRILNLIGDQVVSRIKSDEVSETLIREGLKISTVNRYLSVLAACGVPVSYRKNREGRRDRIISDAELEELDSRVRAHSDDACKALYAILRETGCRGLAEWERLDWSRVDWHGKTLELDSRKGGIRYRTVPMTPMAERALSWLYHTKSSIRESQWRSFWSSVRLSKENVPYSLRHKLCTRMLSKGVPPPTVMRIMGHTNLDQTMEYFHQSADALRDVANKLSTL